MTEQEIIGCYVKNSDKDKNNIYKLKANDCLRLRNEILNVI
jgi:hypothetical protein